MVQGIGGLSRSGGGEERGGGVLLLISLGNGSEL